MIAVVMKSRSTHYVIQRSCWTMDLSWQKAGAFETNQTGGQNALPRQEREAVVPELVPAHRGAAGARKYRASGVTVVPRDTGAPRTREARVFRSQVQRADLVFLLSTAGQRRKKAEFCQG